MKRRLCGIAAVLLILLLSACGRNSSENAAAPTESRSVSPSPAEEKGEPGEETGDMELKLKIGDTEVSVRWEDNGSVHYGFNIGEAGILCCSIYAGDEGILREC